MRLLSGILICLVIPLAAATGEAPPVTVTVSVTGDARLPVAFEGVAMSADGRKATPVKREFATVRMPVAGEPVTLALTVASSVQARRVALTGTVVDYLGAPVMTIDTALDVPADQRVTERLSFTPTAGQPGPFNLLLHWQSDDDRSGSVRYACGSAAAHLLVDPFEEARITATDSPVYFAAEAAVSGSFGLLARIAPDGETPGTVEVTLSRSLPGRPTAVGIHVRTPQAVTLSLQLRDPGTDFYQSVRYDRWRLGPVNVAAGDWQYVLLPMPDYGRQQSEARSAGEADGIVDYPLTAEKLVLSGAVACQVALDDLDVWTQIEESATRRIELLSAKPFGLLYPEDSMLLTVSNGWLWAAAADYHCTVTMRDLNGTAWPLLKRDALHLAPGSWQLLPASVAKLPQGAYSYAGEMTTAGAVVSSLAAPRPIVVYRPEDKTMPPPELHAYLTDRERLLIDLGFAAEVLPAAWHSTDNSVSVEPFMGHFDFGWYADQVALRVAAGLTVVGRLGFTPQWADTDAKYNTHVNMWGGNVNTLPARSIYWEEYVYRTLRRFAGTIDTWIVWDRPDDPGIASGGGEFTERLLRTCYLAAHEADTDARLVSGGITRDRMQEFVEELVVAGAGAYLDAVGLLPTTAPLSPEAGYMDVLLARLARLREREGFAPELWALNLGWPTGIDNSSVSEMDQACFVSRAYLLARANGVSRVLLEPHDYVLQGDGIHVRAQRDSAAFVFESGGLFGIKPAALAVRQLRRQLAATTFVREISLFDRRPGLARALLFRADDGTLLLTAWRQQGASDLDLPLPPAAAQDGFGNALVLDQQQTVTLGPLPAFFRFADQDVDQLSLALERSLPRFADAPESAWKRAWTFFLDVGNDADEQAADYQADESHLVGPIDSQYHNDYGQRLQDSGRHVTGSEQFTVDVSRYGDADLLLRRRLNYAVANQRAEVYCDDEFVGQWFSYKRDRRFRWRDAEFIVANRFLRGRAHVTIRLVRQGKAPFTSYAYWGAPLQQRRLYLSDLSLLVNTSGYGPGVARDSNILGGPMHFFKTPDATFDKGIGTNAAGAFQDSLVVVPLNKQYKRFRATVGIDASTNGRGTVRFAVGDGVKQLFDSKDMTYYSEPQLVDIDVSDSILLILNTNDSGDGSRNDIANWADACLELK